MTIPDLPVIQPDESGDAPRCRAECGSFYTETQDEQEMGWTRCVADSPYDETGAGDICQPRLLRVYAKLRDYRTILEMGGTIHPPNGSTHISVTFTRVLTDDEMETMDRMVADWERR